MMCLVVAVWSFRMNSDSSTSRFLLIHIEMFESLFIRCPLEGTIGCKYGLLLSFVWIILNSWCVVSSCQTVWSCYRLWTHLQMFRSETHGLSWVQFLSTPWCLIKWNTCVCGTLWSICAHCLRLLPSMPQHIWI